MEQDVETGYRTVCSTCLSSDRNLFSINGVVQMHSMFRLIMLDFAGDRFGDILDMEQFVCWECLALLKRFFGFKQQVHHAQEHLRVLAMSQAQESLDHTYISQSLSSLDMNTKVEYDKIFFDYTPEQPVAEPWQHQYTFMSVSEDVKHEQYELVQNAHEHINLDLNDQILEVPEIVLENPMTGVMSHIVVGSATDAAFSETSVKGEPKITIEPIQMDKNTAKVSKDEPKVNYVTEYMSEAEMMNCREENKNKVQYASSVYKCELCIIGFYNQQQVEDHFVAAHRAKPGYSPCKVCYTYVESSKLGAHVDTHYFRYICRLCGHIAYSSRLIATHVDTHLTRHPHNAIEIGGGTRPRKKKGKEPVKVKSPPKPGDLRKLLCKTTIEGYQCLECDMFFKSSRARKNHVARFHREGLQCDHCKKRFVNRTTLATHLRLHEGPLPREECPICHKMVRVIQLKYHIKRHQSVQRHECSDCNKVFSHLATYHAHLKYSRAHAHENVYKYPCPMCNKGYPTKEQMQDHFNYQHLGKTTHKCPVCNKPIASRANVEKHVLRVHTEKKDKPRNHRCHMCGKAFSDKKALTQHEVIHSGERPLTCDICQQTFKQKASLYTHRKRVHKVFPSKRVVEFMDTVGSVATTTTR